MHSTASIGKILLLAEVSVRFADGRLDPGEMLTRGVEEVVADSGLWQHLRADTLPAADVAALVGAVSDNLATNVLLRRVSLAAVTERGRSLGLVSTALHDRVRDLRRPTDPPALSTGTAAELSELMSRLHRGQVRSRAVSRRVLDWLALNTDTSMTGGALGMDPLAHVDADRSLTLANKTGTDHGVRADVGVATGPLRAVAYAVLAAFDDADRDRVLGEMFSWGQRIRHLTVRERAGGSAGVPSDPAAQPRSTGSIPNVARTAAPESAAVSTHIPSAQIATECSTCAARAPSRVTTVHPSSSSRVAGRPRVSIGSMASAIPGTSRGPLPRLP